MLPARPGFVAVVSHAGEVAVPRRFPLAAGRHLLFGLLALQNGIINQGQLVAASRPGCWTSPGAWPTTCASQQAAPSEKSAAPRTRPITRPAGESGGEPSSTSTTADGAIAIATPVPASSAAVIVSNVFISGCAEASGGSNAPLHLRVFRFPLGMGLNEIATGAFGRTFRLKAPDRVACTQSRV